MTLRFFVSGFVSFFFFYVSCSFALDVNNNFTLINKQHITRSPVCSMPEIKAKLRFLRLLGDIKNNDHLKVELIERYGEKAWVVLAEKHPFLLQGTALVDVTTVDWLIHELMYINHKHAKKIVIPFLLPTSDAFKMAMTRLLGNSIKGQLGSKIVFITKEMKDQYRLWLEQSVGKSRFMHIYLREIKEMNLGLSDEVYKEWGREIYNAMMHSEHLVTVGESEKSDDILTVEIIGHAKAGVLALFNNEYENLLLPALVQRLLEHNLLGIKTRIKLLACQSGCGSDKSTLQLTKNEIEIGFQNGLLHSYLKIGLKDSLLAALRKEVSRQYPIHSAPIQGYFGAIQSLPKSNVLHMDGTRKHSYATRLTGKDGENVILNLHQMAIELNP